MSRRIGITMRVVQAHGYFEERDALARDWPAFMHSTLPDAILVPVPNSGARAVEMARELAFDGLILSGGENVGECPARDETEHALLRFATTSGMPVLGVCRGLQMFQSFFGGVLGECAADRHVATVHRVTLTSSARFDWSTASADVNSFHRQGVPVDGLASDLVAIATSEDGFVEGAAARDRPWVAVQWHPERERPLTSISADVVRRALVGRS